MSGIRLTRFVLSVVLSSATTIAVAQAPAAGSDLMKSHWWRWDAGVAAAGQFTTDLTNQTVQLSGAGAGWTEPHQTTTMSPGALVTLHAQPYDWAGIELNYQYTRFSERFFVTAPGAPFGPANNEINVPTSVHEATATYLVHVGHLYHFKPYFALGGGALAFEPPTSFHHQWRGAALADIGFDLQTSSALGFRLGTRDLAYRAPNFANAGLSSSRWSSTEEPYAGVYVKF